MDSECIWARDSKSERAWFVPPHEGEDDEHPAIENAWSYCPYCGGKLVFQHG